MLINAIQLIKPVCVVKCLILKIYKLIYIRSLISVYTLKHRSAEDIKNGERKIVNKVEC